MLFFLIKKLLSNVAFTIYFTLWVCSLLFFSRFELYKHLNNLSNSVADLRTNFISEVAHHTGQLITFTKSTELKNALQDETLVDTTVKLSLQEMIESDPHVLKVSLLDKTGEERLIITPSEDGKGDSDIVKNRQVSELLFNDTMKLNEGDIYVSDLDLVHDVTGEQIFHQPILNIASPLFTHEKSRWGVLVISLDFQYVIDQIEKNDANIPMESQLLITSDGQWIRGVDRKDDWSYLISTPYISIKREQFFDVYPRAWRKIKQNGKPFVMTEQGLFAFKKINLIKDIQESIYQEQKFSSYYEKGLDTNDYYLILISYVTPLNMVKGFLYTVLFPHLLSIFVGSLILGSLRLVFKDLFVKEYQWKKKR